MIAASRFLLLAWFAAFGVGAAPAPASAPADLRQRIEISSGQERAQNIDLMRSALQGSMSDEQRAWFLDRLSADQLFLRRWQDALDSARQGLELKAIDNVQRLRFNTLKANAVFGQAQPGEALRICEEMADETARLLKGPDGPGYRRALEAQRMKGMALLALARRAAAMELLTDTLRRYDKIDEPAGRAETLHVIASLRDISGDRLESLRTERVAIETAEAGHVKGLLPRLHAFMSYLHGKVDNEEVEFKRELDATREAALAEGDEYTLAKAMFNSCDLATRHEQWAEALRLADEARVIFLRIGDLSMADLTLFNRGLALNRMGHPEGIELLRRAIAGIASRPGQEYTLLSIQKNLAEELAFNRNYEQAYLAQLEYQRRAEAVRQNDNQKRIAEVEAAYQADRREQQIASLEQEHEQQKRFRWLWVLVGMLGLAVAVVTAVSRIYLKRAYRAMHDMALEDPLTGLHNRRYLTSRIGEELAQARRQRHQGRPPQVGVAFLLIDLDHFKSINDEHGHAAGDAVLRQASALLRSLVRQSDTLVRWGGEEFLVFAKVSSCEEAGELAERICARMAAHEFDAGAGRTLRRTCSIGFACHPGLSQETGDGLAAWESLVSLADQCLYSAKASGRDQWVGLRCDDGDASPADVRTGVAQGDYILNHRPGREVRWAAETP